MTEEKKREREREREKYHSSAQRKWRERKNAEVTLKRWSEREEKSKFDRLQDTSRVDPATHTVENE